MAKREKAKPKTSGASAKDGRIRKLTRKQSRQKAKIEARKKAKLPNSLWLAMEAYKTISKHWRPLGGILLVYLILSIIFGSGLSSLGSTTTEIKDNLNSGQSSHFVRAVGSFGTLIGGSGSNTSAGSSVLQTMLLILVSLVIIWALRQLLAGHKVDIKQAYYHSMAPLIPFLLVIFVLILQLLPMTLGTAALGLVLTSIVTSQALVTVLFCLLFIILAGWSFYMLSSSIFALYIVTLPHMEPLQALRSAKSLVHFRRWQLMRKIVFLPIFILAAMVVLILPLILTATSLAAPAFYVLGAVSILFAHTYLYGLYRSLL